MRFYGWGGIIWQKTNRLKLVDDDFQILVDEGLEDVIKDFFHWEIETCNSCINYRGSVWIEFCDFHDGAVSIEKQHCSKMEKVTSAKHSGLFFRKNPRQRWSSMRRS